MNIKINKHSLLYRTSLTLILFSIVILVCMYLFQIVFLNTYYEKYKIKQVNDFVQNIKLNNLDNYLEDNTVKSDVCALVIGEEPVLYNEYMKGCILYNPNNTIKKAMKKMINSKDSSTFIKITNPLYHSKTFLYGLRLNSNTYLFINSQ